MGNHVLALELLLALPLVDMLRAIHLSLVRSTSPVPVSVICELTLGKRNQNVSDRNLYSPPDGVIPIFEYAMCDTELQIIQLGTGSHHPFVAFNFVDAQSTPWISLHQTSS
jgi:hypothetical protein